ncbi:uncharacterized protein LOC129586333 isoform X2 [Paramacrobiotus metropolitanus]|uniref:uncharacterized protein LOC129586333 isoform X2 n=1 Tax=Paramacrobiotus metropolitanus TaxID=2943436 RepID=UPI002445840B|nr:uncharacterized protein LOC129586333 isoform X2 [Paramacrobiotus metropolitanus]
MDSDNCFFAEDLKDHHEDQTVFLAKRILKLHHGYEDMQRRVQHLEAANSGRERRSPSAEMDFSEVTERTINGGKIGELPDSGCLASPTNSVIDSSPNSECGAYDKMERMSNAGKGSQCENEHDDHEMSMGVVELDPPFVPTVDKVVQKIAHIEQEYTEILHSVLAGMNTRGQSFHYLNEIYLRHKALLKSLVNTDAPFNQTSMSQAHIRMNFLFRMLIFWTDQKILEMYIKLLGSPFDAARIQEGQQDFVAATYSDISFVVKQIIWKHLHFLAIYFKGVRDSSTKKEFHIDHLICTLDYLVQQVDDDSLFPESNTLVLPRPAFADLPIPTQTVLQLRDQSVQTDLDNQRIRLEYVEGTSYSVKIAVQNCNEVQKNAFRQITRRMSLPKQC